MLRDDYQPGVCAGSIYAAGTLGQLIPPAIMLVLLGDVLSAAYQQAQLEQGILRRERWPSVTCSRARYCPGWCLCRFMSPT